MNKHEKINYLEFAAVDLAATKTFFEQVFDWQFSDYGPDYSAFANAGIDGGFYSAPLSSRSERGGALVVLYSDSLPTTQAKICAAGGRIVKPLFAFPGGFRFHFCEPSGNEFAVWSERSD